MDPPALVRRAGLARAALLGVVLGAAAGCRRPPPDPPSLLLVTIDTLRGDALGCTGGPAGGTPVLDALAEDGLLSPATRAHVPLTLPSHASIFTGLLPPAHGLHDNGPWRLPGDLDTLATRLHAAGHATAAVIGGQPLASGCGLERGFEQYLDPPVPVPGRLHFAERTAAEVTDAALGLVGGPRPQFLWVHYFDPHFPYRPPDAPRDADPRSLYQGEVSYVDAELGRLITALRRDGKTWLVAVTSDHGEGLGDHGELTHGYQVFDSTLSVVTVLARVEGDRTRPPDPGLAPGLPLRHVDLYPTLLALLGQEVPAGLDGVNLLAAPPAGTAYVESLAASLHFGWAQITGVRVTEGLLLHAGVVEDADALDVPCWPTPVAGEVFLPGSSTAFLPAQRLPEWRDALRVARREGASLVPSGTSADLLQLGYLAGPTDAARHRLLDLEDNARLPSPLWRGAFLRDLLQAIQALGDGRGNAALAQLEDLSQGDPTNPTVLFFLGRTWLDLARRERSELGAAEAAAAFAAVVALEPSYPGARLLQAQALGLSGSFAEAVALAPDRAHRDAAWEELLGGLLLESTSLGGRANPLHDPDAGLDHLLQALELAPSNARLRRALEERLEALPASDPAVAEARARLRAIPRGGAPVPDP